MDQLPKWTAVAELTGLRVNEPSRIRVNELDLALIKTDMGAVFVLDNRCTHCGGQLSDGKVSGNDIICPLHGYDFDLVTGVSRYDTSERVATYPARIHDGWVEIDANAVPLLPTGHDEGYLARWARPTDPGLRGDAADRGCPGPGAWRGHPLTCALR